MRRRDFLEGVAASAVGLKVLSHSRDASPPAISGARKPGQKTTVAVSLDGYTPVAEFKRGEDSWKVYEDLRTREGSLVFVSLSGGTQVLTKSAEASMAEGNPYLGLALAEIGLSRRSSSRGG
jgi:hypothetical protein